MLSIQVLGEPPDFLAEAFFGFLLASFALVDGLTCLVALLILFLVAIVLVSFWFVGLLTLFTDYCYKLTVLST